MNWPQSSWGPELEPASDDKSEDVELPRRAAHPSPRMRIGVEEDGALELVHGGGELVRAKVGLEVREVVDRRGRACHALPRSRTPGRRRFRAPLRFDSRDGIGQGSVLWIVCLYVGCNLA